MTRNFYITGRPTKIETPEDLRRNVILFPVASSSKLSSGATADSRGSGPELFIPSHHEQPHRAYEGSEGYRDDEELRFFRHLSDSNDALELGAKCFAAGFVFVVGVLFFGIWLFVSTLVHP